MKYREGSSVHIVIEGNKNNIEVSKDQTILESLTATGIMLESICGGRGTCGKCKVRVLAGQVLDRHGNDAVPEQDGSYLACQVYPAGDVILDKIQRAGVSAKGEIGRINIPGRHRLASVRKTVVNPTYPTLDQNYSLQEMIHKASDGVMQLDVHALRELASLAPEKHAEITLVKISDIITAVEAGDTTSNLYGVAFDIGSTTVAGMLLDVNKGEVMAAAAETNPQAAFGADVISRIKAAATAKGLAKLSTVIRDCLNSLIVRLCAAAGILQHDIYLVTVAGNSTMEHLLMGISPAYLTVSPYIQAFKYLPPLHPQEIGLNINSGGRIILLPNIASFVGADTTAAAMAVDQDLTGKLTLLIDLGTNGEIVLGHKDKMVVSSTAAGPAFEGAQLSCGMRATPGAIEDVTIGEDVVVKTIGDQKAAGICGSGVIKAIAEMVRAGVITTSGRFGGASQLAKLPGGIRERLREKDSRKEFVLSWAAESATGSDIVVTQADIREIQLVKSSICTGSRILMESIGVTPEEIDQVLIAGAFGNYIDLDSAVAIGLIPVSERRKIRAVGNAAGEGAAKALLSEPHLNRCKAIAGKAGFIELANHPHFQEMFVKNLAFPEVTRS